jgi:hypothetical protein
MKVFPQPPKKTVTTCIHRPSSRINCALHTRSRVDWLVHGVVHASFLALKRLSIRAPWCDCNRAVSADLPRTSAISREPRNLIYSRQNSGSAVTAAANTSSFTGRPILRNGRPFMSLVGTGRPCLSSPRSIFDIAICSPLWKPGPIVQGLLGS